MLWKLCLNNNSKRCFKVILNHVLLFQNSVETGTNYLSLDSRIMESNNWKRYVMINRETGSNDTFAMLDAIGTQQTFVLMKTAWRRLSSSSSEDVFKTPWSRPIYSSCPYVFKTSQDVFKTSSRRLQEIFKRSCQYVKRSWRCLAKISSRRF